MDFRMRCPHCGKGVKVAPEHVGRRARCPHCQESIVLQPPPQDSLPVPSPQDSSTPTPAASAVPMGAPANAVGSQESLVHALQEHTAALREFTAQMSSIGSAMAPQIIESVTTALKPLEQWPAILRESSQQQLREMQGLHAEISGQHKELLEQARSAHQGQMDQAAQMAQTLASLTDAAAQLPAHLIQIHNAQARSAKELAAAMATDLRTVQDQLSIEGQERAKAEAAALHAFVAQASEAVGQLGQQVAGLPERLATALDACGADLRQQTQAAAREAVQAFRQQSAALADLRSALQEDVRQFTAQVQQVRAGQGELLADALSGARQGLAQFQQQQLAGQQQAALKLERVAASIAEQGQQTTRQLASVSSAIIAEAARTRGQLDQVRAGADQAAEERRVRLSAEAEKLLTEVYVRSEQVMRQTWELATRAASEHEAKLAALADKMLRSLAQSQQALMQPVATLSQLVQRLNKTAPMEQSLAQTLQTLTATDTFGKTLASIDQTLAQMNRALLAIHDSGATRAALAETNGPTE